jgi:prepilin-type processing-associated H-X9-DG protein
MKPRRAVTLTEMLAVVGGICCLTAVSFPAVLAARDAASQALCGANLAQLGSALLTYAGDHDGYLPDSGAASSVGGPLPQDGWHYPGRWDSPGTGAWPDVRDVGNQANLWLLVRQGYAAPAQFICPATSDRPSLNDPGCGACMGFYALDSDTAAPTPDEAAFLRRVAAGRCSYSYQNQFAHPNADETVVAPENATTHRLVHPAMLAIAADRNPYARPRLTRQPVVSPTDLPQANSLNHQGRGQNVLYLGGHVEWHESPCCGAARPDGTRDNIYWPEVGMPDDPRNVPRSLTDSFLVP